MSKRSKVALQRVIKKNAPLERTRFLPLLFCFDQHGLSVPDSINEFPNRVRPDQMSHTTASDLGIIDCFFFSFLFFFFFLLLIAVTREYNSR